MSDPLSDLANWKPSADLLSWGDVGPKMTQHRELKRDPGGLWVECACGTRFYGTPAVSALVYIRDHIRSCGGELEFDFPRAGDQFTMLLIKKGELLDWTSDEFEPGTGTFNIYSSEPGNKASVMSSFVISVLNVNGSQETHGGLASAMVQWRQNQVVVSLPKARRIRLQTNLQALSDMTLAIHAPGAKPLAHAAAEAKIELTSEPAAGLAEKEAHRMTLEEWRKVKDTQPMIGMIASRLTAETSPAWTAIIHEAIAKVLMRAQAYDGYEPTTAELRRQINASCVARGRASLPDNDPMIAERFGVYERFEALIAEHLGWSPHSVAPPSAIAPPSPIPSLPQEQAMPESPSHVPTVAKLSEEMRGAAYQIAAGKLTEVTAQSLGSLLQRELADDSPEVRARIGKFLEGTTGEMTTALLLSALVGPLGGQLADHLGLSSKQLDLLSSALRVHAMVHGGSALLDTVSAPLLGALKEALRGLPAEDSGPRLLPEAQARETIETSAVKVANKAG